jgi:tRNA-(ms[2]io[6]A)-hydroxylase
MKLHSATDPSWVTLALERFDAVLNDHAHCEKKAAANALSLLQSYPEVPGLPALMARLAREESSHLAKVLALMETRGLRLSYDAGDPYAKGLQQLMRNPHPQRRLDRLLVAGVIEARSHERLQLLADALPDPELRRLYAELAQSEDGHQELFFRLAQEVEAADTVAARLEELLAQEAVLLAQLPVRAAIH